MAGAGTTRRGLGLEQPRQLHEMRRVVRSVDAARQHLVVARLLAFLTEAGARDPDERVEPVGGPQELARDLDDPVAAMDVRELVAQDDGGAVLGPRLRGAREDHLRPPESPGHEQRRMFALQQLHGRLSEQLAADLVGQPRPHSWLDRTRVRGEPGEACQAHGENEAGSGRRRASTPA